MSTARTSQLVPLLKGTGMAATRGEQFALSPDDSPVARPFAADIVIVYAFNEPSQLVYMSRRQLAQSGMSEDELHALAVANLPKCLPDLNFRELDGGLFGVSCGGVFEASLLLLDPLWEQLAPQLPGLPLAVVPARDLLFVTGSKNQGSMQKIGRCARAELAQPELELSRVVLSRSRGRWEKSLL